MAVLLVLLLMSSGCQGVAQEIKSTSTVGVNVLVPFLEPEANHQPILAAIQDAQRSIRMEMYLLTDRDVIDALIKAQARGVDVRILVEGQPAGVGTGNKPAISELGAANVAVRVGNPAFELTHSKFMVVDERVAVLMSFDLTRAAFTLNRGFGIIDQDAADVDEMTRVFEADWGRYTAAPSASNLVWGPGDSRKRIIDWIDGATRTLDIEMDTLRDDEIEQRIVRAIRRGVLVRMIVSPSEKGPDLNAPAIRRLREAGVQIRTLKVPYIQTLMMVADGETGYIGSQEFTPVSLDSSRELGIILTAKRIVGGLQGTFAVDWDIAR